MERQDIISSGLLETYALGIASGEEILQVENWIKQYPEIKEEIIAIQKAMESYAMLHSVEPSTSLKDSISQKLQLNKKDTVENTVEKTVIPHEAKVVRMSPYFNWAAAASFILLMGSIVFNVVYFNKYQNAEIAKNEAESQLLAQNEENRNMQNDMSVVQSRYSEPVALRGLEAAPNAAAKIFWMKNTGDVYVDPSNLPEAPPGKQYQLWAIVDGKPVDGGMLNPVKKEGKIRIQKMKSFGRAEAFAITLETEGGNPTPKGDMYVMGKI